MVETKVVLGGVYYNPSGDEIHVQFVDEEYVGFDRFTDGTKTSVDDMKLSAFIAVMVGEGFVLDHVETW